jgi:thioredoxin-related protein
MSFIRIASIVALSVLLAGCGGGEGKVEKTSTWMSFEAGMDLARDIGKPVVIDFYTSWCRWCKVMDKKTFSDTAVASYLSEHFITIRVDAEQTTGDLKYGGRTYTPAGLAKAFRLRGYPSVAYLDEKGGLIFVDTGFKEPGQFMLNLKYVTSGCYRKDVSIEEFRRRGGQCG